MTLSSTVSVGSKVEALEYGANGAAVVGQVLAGQGGDVASVDVDGAGVGAIKGADEV